MAVYLGKGTTIDTIVGTDTLKGDVVRIGSALIGVAQEDALDGSSCLCVVEGVIEGVKKKTGNTIGFGDRVGQTVAGQRITDTDANRQMCGTGMDEDLDDEIEMTIRLWPSSDPN